VGGNSGHVGGNSGHVGGNSGHVGGNKGQEGGINTGNSQRWEYRQLEILMLATTE